VLISDGVIVEECAFQNNLPEYFIGLLPPQKANPAILKKS